MQTDHQSAVQPAEQSAHKSDPRFTSYYAEVSLGSDTRDRFTNLMHKLLRTAFPDGSDRMLKVADIGCGPGSQASVWASEGHAVFGVDINESFIEIARTRAKENGHNIDFQVGSATALPWETNAMDLCLLPELLEHVAEWRQCLDEAARVLRTGGLLYLSTSNKLCPVQHEFRLPLYSWYPAPLKRHYERLSVTSRPELVNFATYPAVNWFSYYSLRKELRRRGMRVMDRFEFNAATSPDSMRRAVFKIASALAPVKLLGHLMTPYTVVVARKL